MSRRRVVVRPEFFERLDELLPEERTPAGDPSTADFLLHDLTAAIDTLAENFLRSTLPVEDSEVRVFIFAGMTIPLSPSTSEKSKTRRSRSCRSTSTMNRHD